MNDFGTGDGFGFMPSAPLLARADHGAPSVFRVENMLREARRQKELAWGQVPDVCVIDPDGDIVDYIRQSFAPTRCGHWACYHTRMWEWTTGGVRCGIVGRVVGGSFSVLVAEQLFASGCELLINVTSFFRDPDSFDELNRDGSNLSETTVRQSLRLTYGYDGGQKLVDHLDEYFDTPEHAEFAIQMTTNPHWYRYGETPSRP